MFERVTGVPSPRHKRGAWGSYFLSDNYFFIAATGQIRVWVENKYNVCPLPNGSVLENLQRTVIYKGELKVG